MNLLLGIWNKPSLLTLLPKAKLFDKQVTLPVCFMDIVLDQKINEQLIH